MTPAFFGEPAEQLLGLHHEPVSGDRGEGVVLCSSAPQETQQTHWQLRRLANALTRDGFHVLRFDYFGTGDSAGSTPDGHLERWANDAVAAAKELRELTGIRTISMVGLRVGAYVAARASLAGAKLKSLVLWEPPLSGQSWLYDMERIQSRRFNLLSHPPRVERDEVLGYFVPEQARLQLISAQLPSLAFNAERAAMVTAQDSASHARASETISQRHPIEYRAVPEAGGTTPGEGQGAMLAANAVQNIAAYLAGRPA